MEIHQDQNVIGSYYAKTHFAAVMDKLGEGNSFIITRNGKKMAKLIPYDDEQELVEKKRKAQKAYEEIIEIRKNITLGPDLTIKDLINAGRKY